MTSPSLCITVIGLRALAKSGNFFPSCMSSDNISYARLPSLSVKYFSWPGGYSSHFLQPQMLADQLYDLQEKHLLVRWELFLRLSTIQNSSKASSCLPF